MGLNLLMTVILTASLVVVVVTSSSSLVEDGDVEPASGTSERSGLLGTARPNGVLDATKERPHPPWQDDFFGLIRSRNRRNPPNGPYGQPPYGWRPGGYFGFPGQMPFCPRTTAAAATTAAATTAAATTAATTRPATTAAATTAAATTAAATTAAATTAATTRPATTAAAAAAATTAAAAIKHPNPMGYYYYY